MAQSYPNIRYRVDFDAKKRHSTRRDVNFLNMTKNLVFYQKRGLGEQERRKFRYFLYGHCVDVFPPTLMGKGVFGFWPGWCRRGAGKNPAPPPPPQHAGRLAPSMLDRAIRLAVWPSGWVVVAPLRCDLSWLDVSGHWSSCMGRKPHPPLSSGKNGFSDPDLIWR